MAFRFVMQGATSGLKAEFPFAAAYRIEDGLIVEITGRRRAEDALEAAGLEK